MRPMSEIPSTTRCPKCGYQSRDDHVCDACGAVFSKVRQREVEQELLAARESEPTQQAPGTVSFASFAVKTVLALCILGGFAAAYWFQVGQYKFPTTARLIAWHRQVVVKVRQNYASSVSAKEKTQYLDKRMNETRKLLPMIGALPGPRDALDAMRLAALQGANETAMAEMSALADTLAAEKPEKVEQPMAATEWLLDVAEKPYEQVDGSASIKSALRIIAPAAAESLRQTVILIDDRRKQVRQDLTDSIQKSEHE